MTTKRCRNHKWWIIGDGAYLWCVHCGALRKMQHVIIDGVDNLMPASDWIRPDSNPHADVWGKFFKSQGRYPKKKRTERK
jgi:hypothetical protein